MMLGMKTVLCVAGLAYLLGFVSSWFLVLGWNLQCAGSVRRCWKGLADQDRCRRIRTARQHDDNRTVPEGDSLTPADPQRRTLPLDTPDMG